MGESSMAFASTTRPTMAFMLRGGRRSTPIASRQMSSAPAGAWVGANQGMNALDEALQKGGGKVVVTGADGKIQGTVTEKDVKAATKGKLVVGSRGALRREDSVVGDLVSDDKNCLAGKHQ